MDMMKIIRVKRCAEDIYDKIVVSSKRYREKKKFEDPRCKEVYSQVELTEEQKGKIDELFLTNYGKKIRYIWHQHYTSYTGRFDEKYFPECLYIPEFERFMNMDKAYAKCMEDKNFVHHIAQSVGVKSPKVIVSCVKKALRDKDSKFISLPRAIEILDEAGEVFCKPSIDSDSGRGCMVARFKDGIEELSGKSTVDFLENLGDNFAIQERVRCHKSISDLYSGSVNTFRIITYRWRDNIKLVPSVMRIGGESYVDNVHAGGMFIAIDDDGSLHEKAFTEFGEKCTSHPVSGVVFSGHRIENFGDALNSAKRLHEAVAQLGVINWDFTIDEQGEPVLIEANVLGGTIIGMEAGHGKSLFGEDTAEILRWMRVMNNTPRSKRKQYEFGYNFE